MSSYNIRKIRFLGPILFAGLSYLFFGVVTILFYYLISGIVFTIHSYKDELLVDLLYMLPILISYVLSGALLFYYKYFWGRFNIVIAAIFCSLFYYLSVGIYPTEHADQWNMLEKYFRNFIPFFGVLLGAWIGNQMNLKKIQNG